MKKARIKFDNLIVWISLAILFGVFAVVSFFSIKSGATLAGIVAAGSIVVISVLYVKNYKKYIKLLKNEKGLFTFIIFLSLIIILWLFRSIATNRYYSDFYRGIVFLLLVAMLSLFFIITLIMCDGEKPLHRIYFPIGLIMGIVFMMMLPAYQVPDEVTHAGTAYRISNSILGVENSNDSKLKMRYDDAVSPELTRNVTREQREQAWNKLFKKAKDTRIIEVDFPFLNTYSIQYVVPALGLSAGRAGGLSTATILLLGRLFNLVFFVSCITLAIKIIPFGKYILFTIGLLPITIQQGMSFSYDVLLISCSFLYIAEVFYWMENGISRFSWKEKMHLALLIASFIPLMLIKQHAYTPMALLLLLIPAANSKIDLRNVLRWISRLIIIGTLVVVVAVIWLHYHPLEEPTNTFALSGKQMYTVQHILNHPVKSISVFGYTLIYTSAFYIMSGLGSQLGWLDIPTNMLATLFFMPLLLVVMNIDSNQMNELNTGSYKAVYLLVSLLCFGFIMFGMWIGWTEVDSTTIQGVQGRYFIPFLPILLILLSTPKIKIDTSLAMIVPSVVVLLDVITITSLM